MKTSAPETKGLQDGKKVFKEKLTCSRTFFYLLDREFGHPQEAKERAADTLAGGILQKGYQCGMLWGSELAIGAEAYRKCSDPNEATQVALEATQGVMKSFEQREGTINCREITHCDFSNKFSMAWYMLSGRYRHCYNLAQEWAPEAVRIAREKLSRENPSTSHPCLSCASIVAQKMGASEVEIATVAGFAGGLGLSGGGCGALAAALWIRSLQWCQQNEASPMKNKESQKIIEAFLEATESVMQCENITGRRFENIQEHTEFIAEGGCKSLLETLAKS